MKLNQFSCSRIGASPKTALAAILMLAAWQAQAQPAPATQYVVTRFAGNGTKGFAGDGSAANAAELNAPVGLALDASHSLYIADQLNERIRQVVSSTGNINTIAGTGTAGYSGDTKAAINAELSQPSGVVVDSSGNYYIADSANSVIREVTAAGTISTIAGNISLGPGLSGDHGAPTSAQLNAPSALAFDAAGNLYISDTGNNVIRKVVFSQKIILTFAGTGKASYGGDGFPAANAGLNTPRGIAFDSAGNLYIADSANHAIRKVAASNQYISTVAGTGFLGYNGDNIAAASAQLNYPLGVAVDGAGNIFVTDSQNFRIREISNGIITTIAGTGQPGEGGDGLYGVYAVFQFPSAIIIDPSGNLFVADTGNNLVRELSPVASVGPPVINPGGIVGASAFGQFTEVAPGSWIEIYGQNLAVDRRTWQTSDFRGSSAPTSLDGTSVSIGGQPAYISFISPTQVNAQVPTTIATGPQRVIVTVGSSVSVPAILGIGPLEVGFYAPPSLSLNGVQYVWAQLPDGSIALPASASVTGTVSRPAKAGDTMVLYGVGFGPVTPAVPAGQMTPGENQLAETYHFEFAGVPAQVAYAGLSPGSVGLYQVNVVVPNVNPGDAIPITFTIANARSRQTLYTSVAQ